jgi:hypothetical protein
MTNTRVGESRSQQAPWISPLMVTSAAFRSASSVRSEGEYHCGYGDQAFHSFSSVKYFVSFGFSLSTCSKPPARA